MSKIILHTHPFHYLEIKDMWSEQEHQEMFDEMLMFESKGLFLDASLTGSATDDDGLLKKNKAEFMDEVWAKREYSSILTHNRRIVEVLSDAETEKSWFFNKLEINNDSTLISYYEDSDYYKPHRDSAKITLVSYFFKEPKSFNGGVLKFTDYDLKFEVKNNLTIVFPSNIRHEVSEISMDEGSKGKQQGRFCMTQFLRSTL